MVRKFDGVFYLERGDFVLPSSTGPDAKPTRADKALATRLFGFVVRALRPEQRIRTDEDIFVQRDAVWELSGRLADGTMQHTGIINKSHELLGRVVGLHCDITPEPPASVSEHAALDHRP